MTFMTCARAPLCMHASTDTVESAMEFLHESVDLDPS